MVFTVQLFCYAVVDFSMKLMQVQGIETPHRVQDIYRELQKCENDANHFSKGICVPIQLK